MKHHGIIFAMGTGVPTIAIALGDYYIRKNLGALKVFNQEQWLINREGLFSLGIMEKKIDAYDKKFKEQKAIIASHLKEKKKQDGEVIDRFLREVLERKRYREKKG